MKTERLVGMLSMLLTHERLTVKRLAEEFEVSARTVMRDIESLCLAGLPVCTARGRDGGVYLQDGYRLDRALFCEQDLRDILCGLRTLESVSPSRRYARLIDRVSAGGARPEDGHMLVDLASWYKQPLSDAIAVIEEAMRDGRLIRFRYLSKNGETVREAEPYYLVYRWSDWYVYAHCLLRGEMRLFKLLRMSGLCLGGGFAPRQVAPPDLSPHAVFPEECRVRALVDPECRWRLVEEFGESSFSVTADGRLDFDFCFGSSEGVVPWILSFEGRAELVEPRELRARLAEIGGSLAATYGDG